MYENRKPYNFITACQGDIVVDAHGVEFEIFLSKIGAEKGYPILAVSLNQKMTLSLTQEGNRLVPRSQPNYVIGGVADIMGKQTLVTVKEHFFHKPVKKTGWVIIFELNRVRPICKSKIFGSEAEAKNYVRTCQQNILGISEVSWEE